MKNRSPSVTAITTMAIVSASAAEARPQENPTETGHRTDLADGDRPPSSPARSSRALASRVNAPTPPITHLIGLQSNTRRPDAIKYWRFPRRWKPGRGPLLLSPGTPRSPRRSTPFFTSPSRTPARRWRLRAGSPDGRFACEYRREDHQARRHRAAWRSSWPPSGRSSARTSSSRTDRASISRSAIREHMAFLYRTTGSTSSPTREAPPVSIGKIVALTYCSMGGSAKLADAGLPG